MLVDLGYLESSSDAVIQDMDFYDESRTLVYSSSVARRVKSEASFHEWEDLALSLLDNYGE